MPIPYIGQIIMFAGNFAPQGWALCQGQLMPIAENTGLFNLIGTTYGGDGQTSFALPDLRGRVPISQGHGPGLSSYGLGQRAGMEAVAVTVSQLPSHGHAVAAINQPGNAHVPADNTLLSALGGDAASGAYKLAAYATPSDQTTLNAVSVTAAGGGQPHTNIQPYESLNFCIALEGLYPPGA